VRVPNPRKKAKRARRRARAAPRRSPRALYYLTAKKKDGTGQMLTYMGGIKFSDKGRGVPFHSKAQARQVGNELKRNFPVLRKYKLKPV
jgi:hypothetical protein